jgi:hypothetical protein
MYNKTDLHHLVYQQQKQHVEAFMICAFGPFSIIGRNYFGSLPSTTTFPQNDMLSRLLLVSSIISLSDLSSAIR